MCGIQGAVGREVRLRHHRLGVVDVSRVEYQVVNSNYV
jgi:hypothetical protein